MATYIGYYRINEGMRRENDEKSRASGEPYVSPAMREKVVGIRDALPSSIKLIGSYAPIGAMTQTYPAVWIVETDDPAELVFVNNWYRGFIDFEWVPATALGNTSAATTAAMDAARR